jgi:predicted GNAT family N-acyltransferase
MPPADPIEERSEFRVEPLNKARHRRENFECEVPDLTAYLRTKARKEVEARICACFVLVPASEPGRIAGYYTLSSATIETATLPPKLAHRLPRYPRCPATLLGRLARDSAFRGKGIGELLLVSALKRALENTHQVGSIAVVTDPKDANAADFYATYGFRPIAADETRLMLPMAEIKALMEGAQQ